MSSTPYMLAGRDEAEVLHSYIMSTSEHTSGVMLLLFVSASCRPYQSPKSQTGSSLRLEVPCKAHNKSVHAQRNNNTSCKSPQISLLTWISSCNFFSPRDMLYHVSRFRSLHAQSRETPTMSLTAPLPLFSLQLEFSCPGVITKAS